MAQTREVRRLALQALYQLDARQDEAPEAVLDTVAEDDEGAGSLSSSERRRALELARSAFEGRGKSDAFMLAAAPDWPPHRQAAVDRAILRLAHHEMTAGLAPPKAAISEAVELAKTFSTEKSPAFINGLLDRLLKSLPGDVAAAGTGEGAPAGDAPAPTVAADA